MTQEQLLKIPLGESVVNGRWDILRVIGGWVYSQLFYEHNSLCGADLVINSSLTSIFVPEPKPVDNKGLEKDKDNAINELLECRSYIMAYDPLLCDGMDLHVSGKFPDGHVAKWIKDEVSK